MSLAASNRPPKVLVILVALLGGGGLFLVWLSYSQWNEANRFAEEGIRAEARITFATETKVGRNPEYTKADVIFFPPGEPVGDSVTAEVIDCPDGRIESGANEVEVIYDPEHPSDARLPECLDKNYQLSLVSGLGLVALDAALIVSVRNSRRRARELATLQARMDAESPDRR